MSLAMGKSFGTNAHFFARTGLGDSSTMPARSAMGFCVLGRKLANKKYQEFFKHRAAARSTGKFPTPTPRKITSFENGCSEEECVFKHAKALAGTSGADATSWTKYCLSRLFSVKQVFQTAQVDTFFEINLKKEYF
ncbi:MAG: hypothetical protein NZM43_06330 [Saprospiraceae bacterium]|nr:hypothetical protein [Saprospiraceae bacterium]MDW8483928.1 hypothetical protein [Saprospiraceae bacterium]